MKNTWSVVKHFIKRWRALLVMIAASNEVLELQIHMECLRSGVTVFHQYMMKNKKIIKDFIKRLVVMMLPPMIFVVNLFLVMILLFLMLLLYKLLVMMLMVHIRERTLLIMIVAISVVMELLIHMVRSSDGAIAFHQFMMKN